MCRELVRASPPGHTQTALQTAVTCWFRWTPLSSCVLLPPWSQGPFLVLPGRLPETTVVYPADVVLFEGILVFYSQEIRDMFHLRLFVDTDSDVRLSRRGKADMAALPLAEASLAP